MTALRDCWRTDTGVVGSVREDFAIGNAVAPQLICDDSSRFPATRSQQSLEEAHRSLSISAPLQEYINHLTVLIHRTPEIVLLALDLHEDLIDEEGVTESLVPAPKFPGVLWPKLDAPQSDRYVADRDSALRHEIFDVTSTQIEAVIEPNRVLNNLRRETVPFVH